VPARAWRLPSGGQVVGLGGAGEEVHVAQARTVTTLGPDNTSVMDLDVPRSHAIVAISRRGERIAVFGPQGLRVGEPKSFDRRSTALSSGALRQPPLVLDGPGFRLLRNDLWDLDVPENIWRAQVSEGKTAIDPSQRWIAVGDAAGVVTVVSAADGSVGHSPRVRADDDGLGVAALDITLKREVVWLDSAGRATCGSESEHVLPAAPLSMPAAVVAVSQGMWALRDGRAVFVRCASGVTRKTCAVSSRQPDPRSAALTSTNGRVYAAGLAHGLVVELPSCS